MDTQGAKPSVALAPDGTPHIAFILEAQPGFLKHAVLEAGSWTVSNVATGYFYGPLDLAVDSEGKPHISWHNHDLENQVYAALIDGRWDLQTVDHSGHDGWDNNLSIDSKGVPHIVSIDPSQFGSESGVEYATLNGGTWKVEEVGSGAVPYEFGTDIALDSADTPHVVWFDDSSKDLKYAIRNGGSWEISTVDADGDVGRFPSLAIDGNDVPSISYFEKTGDSSGFIKLARWNGAGWSTQRIDELNNVFIDFFGARKTSSLALDPDGNAIVAYSDEAAVKLAQWDGTRWSVETVMTAGELPLGQQVSLAIDDQQVLHLVFADVSKKGGPGVVGAVKYANSVRASALAGQEPDPVAGKAPSSTEASPGQSESAPYVEPIPVVDPDPDYQNALANSSVSPGGWETDFTRHTVPYSDIISGGVPRDGIPPLDDPKFTTPANANEWLKDREPVIAFELNGDARAYPLQVMTWHEIVNDEVGGVPVAATFCPLCNSAIVFDRRLDGVVFDFGTSGKLRNSDLIMWDRQTESWWQQLTGDGIVGTMAGRRLTFLPASIISWADFKAAYPAGRVLSRDTGFTRRYGRNPYEGYDRADQPPFLFDGTLDPRLLPKERIAAVTIGDVDVAFPFAALEAEGAVNYTIDGRDVVVFFKKGTASALDASNIGESRDVGATGIFEANLDDRKLTFRPSGDNFVDNETGTVWNILGQAIEGALAGSNLTPIVHANHFWFAWGAFKPDTKIYQSPD